MLEAAERAGAEAIRPGYGFLAENADFARCRRGCRRRLDRASERGDRADGLEDGGPDGDASGGGVPIIPGTTEPVESVEEVLSLGAKVGYPLIVEAAAGGGGKGMKLVESPDEAERALESAQREGEKYFADGRVYVERYLEDPRHVEVQVLADAHGNVIHLGERDCTIQRRHQKLIEESPSPAHRRRSARADRADRGRGARAPTGYRSARGRSSFFSTAPGDYYFMEMNTPDPGRAHRHRGGDGRSISSGEQMLRSRPTSRSRSGRRTSRCAATRSSAGSTRGRVEGLLPAPGRITGYREPSGPGIRVDSRVVADSRSRGLYDPMIAKLIVVGVDREHARLRMLPR